MNESTLKRFLAKRKTEYTGFVLRLPCQRWAGAISGGRGQLGVGGRAGSTRYVHQLAYEHYVGVMPEGKEPDHLCRIPDCSEPTHLEAVTHQENVRRGNAGRISGAQQRAKTQCPYGHLYEGGNLYVNLNGSRSCRACKREWRNRQRQSAKTHCPQGHLYAGANLYLRRGGGRGCRTCKRDVMRARRKGEGQ